MTLLKIHSFFVRPECCAFWHSVSRDIHYKFKKNLIRKTPRYILLRKTLGANEQDYFDLIEQGIFL